jgi:N utilization substance protein B
VEGAYFDRADEAFFQDIVLGVVREQLTIDPLIGRHLARGWRLARIDSILRAILRAASFELKDRLDVPFKVIINEYVDVAHAFFGGDEPGVVNGVLDAIARDIRTAEVPGSGHG